MGQWVLCSVQDIMALCFVLFTALLATSLAKVVDIQKCDGVSDDICSVTQVRMDPCKKASSCVFVKGGDANLSFDFTPNFVASKLKTKVFWDNGVSDVPFDDMESNDGCQYTQCPTQAGTTQTLNYNLHIDKKTPKGTYLIKWKVWDEANDKQVCCFKANIEIKKAKKK